MKQPLRIVLALTALIVVFASTAIATVPMIGKIYTSNSDGTIVNGNIYQTKDQVYVNGGPQHEQQNGITPDGLYYFQVTDPSGANLLSNDDITCRQFVVTGGRIVGVPAGAPPATCSTGYHAIGTPNPLTGQTPVQLLPYDTTPNNGGEYKVWATPVVDYNAGCNDSYGFCHDLSSTDNFKVRQPGVAYVAVCKFNDENNNGIQDPGEPLLAHWPITATGVDGDTGAGVLVQTDDFGCVSFSYSGFGPGHQSQVVTLTEGTQGPDWNQTAPLDCGGLANCSVTNGVITLTLSPDDNVNSPNFGNFNPNCVSGCTGNTLVVTKDAFSMLTKTFTWGITKSVDNTLIDTAGSATFNYTVKVTHDAGTDSGWQVNGSIRVSNPTGADINGINVTDALDTGSNGTCTVTGGTGVTVPAGSHVDLSYVCSYSGAPSPAAGTNTATAAWSAGPTVGTHSYDFATAAVSVVDGSVNITDTLGGTLGTVSYTDPSPKTFTYPLTFTDPAGTCTTHNNTVTFTTNTTKTTGSDNKSVQVCVGADLTVNKTAAGAFNSNITKTVDKTIIEQGTGTATFNYTVTVTESGWNVTGNITVTNPNDWEDVSVNLSDAISGATCTIAGGSPQLVPRHSSISPAYSCTFGAAPSATSGTNTATGTWNAATAYTPHGSASGMFGFSFPSLTIIDTFNGIPTTLGTILGNVPTTTYKYAHTVPLPIGGSCHAYSNTAQIVQTGQTASQTVQVCDTATGALTMGFWQNKNGQALILTGAYTGSGKVCNSGTWLRQYAPFQDLSSTATCSAVATYTYNIVKAANAGGTSMNPMLKSQMLATALDVYFSTPGLGGNKIGAAQPLGGVKIDLTKVCNMIDSSGGSTCSGSYQNVSSAFGGATSLTVSQILAYAASQSNAGGSVWYGQIKTMQGLAKNTFDAINNNVALIAP